MDPVESRPVGEPESLPPSFAELILRRASPWRLLARLGLAALAIGAGALGYAAFRAHVRSELARDAPMVRIPAGTFHMGWESGPYDETPAHDVTLPAFQIDLTEVTVAAYQLCVDDGRCTPSIKYDACNWGRAERALHPVNCVDFHQAEAFCAWAGKRLPTEEEWEYAARGRDGRRFPWGDEAPDEEHLNACDRECAHLLERARGKGAPVLTEASDGWAATAPVGSYPAGDSAFGVKDLAGNVWEWTASPYCRYPPQSDLPGGPGALARCADSRRVSRGGGWSNAYPDNVESTTRSADDPSGWADNRGFRCAR